MVTAVYRDFYRMPAQPLTVSLGADTAVLMGTTLTLHAMVSGGTPPYQILWNTLDTGNTLTVAIQKITTYSVMVVDALVNFASAQKIVSIRYPYGVDDQNLYSLQVYPNPTCGPVCIILPEKYAETTLQVLTPQGIIKSESVENPVNGRISTNLSGLPDGLYFVRILAGRHVYLSKVLLANLK